MSIELFLSLFARIFSFFLLSPLFSGRNIPSLLRFAFAIALTLLLAPTLLATHAPVELSWGLLALQLIKEALVGYLMGFVFSLLLEAAALAGQIVGTMMGLSATELLDPLSNSSSPLLGRFFVLIIATLLIALDFHHALVRTLFESFTLLPTSSYPFSHSVIVELIGGTAHIFTQALSYAWLPFTQLSLLFLIFVFAARMLPDMPLFWTAFPIQLLVGFSALLVTLNLFPIRFTQAFTQLQQTIHRILFALLSGA